MARIIDTRNAGGQLVILGSALVMPTSNVAANSASYPHVAGSIRYNPTQDRVEFLSNSSLTWLATGMNEATTTALINSLAPSIANAAAVAALANGIVFPDGSLANAGIHFANSINTGLSRIANSAVMSVGGTAAITASNTTVTLNLPTVLTANTLPSADAAYDLGAVAQRFNNLYANTITTNNIIANSVTNLSSQYTTNVYPALDNTYQIGDTGNRYKNIYAVTFNGVATSARYADLAERYHADAEYEPGTVLVIGGAKEVTACSQYADYRVAGIVSTDPAYMMNSGAGEDNTHPYIALRGRVPCKVIGPVKKGDLLVTSATLGHAEVCKAYSSAQIVGKALEDFNGDVGLVEVLV